MTQITYGSVCSGIEAASVAWEPLGWKPLWFSEIEPFPSAVLAHHWPQVSNLGDFTDIRHKLADGSVEAPDVLVGGTPCQAYSVAGLRKSLDDARGQLTLQFVGLANAIDDARSIRGRNPCTIVWENVPGVLSTKDNAFGCFLGDLAGEDVPLEPPGGKWANAGYVRGPRRTIAWRVLDAQYFGVAQRRRRVFVVASAGAICPEKVLFEFDGVRRDSPPSRQQGQGASADVAPCIGASGRGVSRSGETRGQDPVVAVSGFSEVSDCLTSSYATKWNGNAAADSGNLFAVEVAATLRSGSTNPSAHGKLNDTDRMDLVVHASDVSQPIRTNHYNNSDVGMEATMHVVTLAIRGRGESRELETRNDGTANALLLPNGGRDGIGCGAVAFQATDYASGAFEPVDQSSPITTSADRTRAAPIQVSGCIPLKASGCEGSNGAGIGLAGDPFWTLDTTTEAAVGIPALAACDTSREGNRFDAESTTMVPGPMQVRRLTPDECAVLQGFPKGHARIPWNRGYWAKGSCSEEARAALQESCPDGPQYKAYGNSMCTNVMAFIGRRLDQHLKATT